MQGWHYGKGLIYYRLIFRLTKLVFLRARTIPRENIFFFWEISWSQFLQGNLTLFEITRVHESENFSTFLSLLHF